MSGLEAFNEVVEDVYVLTKRRDLVAETEHAVRSATLKMHHTDFYSKDLLEKGLEFETAQYRQQLDYISVVPNLRAFKYLRRAENSCDDAGPFFELVTPDELLDSYGFNRNNIYYIAGRIAEIRSCTSFRFALMGCYVHPIVKKGEYCSWIAEQYPYCIIHEATRVIFKTIGKDEEAATYERLVAEAMALLKLSNVQDRGY